MLELAGWTSCVADVYLSAFPVLSQVLSLRPRFAEQTQVCVVSGWEGVKQERVYVGFSRARRKQFELLRLQ